MANYTVKNIREVKYHDMSNDERSNIWRLEDLWLQNAATSFDDENEFFALYEDIDRYADVDGYNDGDDRKYAVYLHNSGRLCCLLCDCTVALNGYSDTDYGMQREELYRQIAMAAGWPEFLPEQHIMTWRDLLDELKKQPDKVLDMPAYVNVTQRTWDGLHEVTSLTTWDGKGEVDLAHNQLLINFMED